MTHLEFHDRNLYLFKIVGLFFVNLLDLQIHFKVLEKFVRSFGEKCIRHSKKEPFFHYRCFFFIFYLEILGNVNYALEMHVRHTVPLLSNVRNVIY